MNDSMKEYYEALSRLKNNCPKIVPMGTKINNDTVALEAGRKRGSIKKGREQFQDLINAIEDTKMLVKKPFEKINKKIKKTQENADKYQKLYEESLNRELMMLETINELEKIYSVKKANVINNI